MSVFGYNEIGHEYGDYRCPKCQSPIVWSLRNGRPGAEGAANCTKHPTQSRIDFNPDTEKFCMWEGIVRRTKSGGVEFFHSDGVTRLRKVSF